MNQSKITPKGYKVLAVDDNEEITELLEYTLSKEGYQVKTTWDGSTAIPLAQSFLPDLILLDISMPIMDGIEAGHLLKQIPTLEDTLLVYLTARIEEYAEVAAFDIGADDYVVKPIKPRALVSRLKALFKHKSAQEQITSELHIADLKIDSHSYTITYHTNVVQLPKKEFELLHFLAQHKGMLFTREQLLTYVWGTGTHITPRTVDVHIRKIRERIQVDYIKTIKGIGYKFDPEPENN
ncbi:response regulator transcription factor [Xanthocytophaga agilis]|uniref:Response regulator transcription factor n=1 Tax=Xanthocytophaga agilis TaxID=3048010 RepID=A0AAE3RCL4_9BACT|nr:response regulator transcription factor [Xanthocytophaga agilis]MDJ1505804.1 response regulator transcription factor [Xanthocytophaga agilis]